MEVDTRVKRVLFFYFFKKILAVGVTIGISECKFCPLRVVKFVSEGQLRFIVAVILYSRRSYIDLGFAGSPYKLPFWCRFNYRMIVIVCQIKLREWWSTFMRFSSRKHLVIWNLTEQFLNPKTWKWKNVFLVVWVRMSYPGVIRYCLTEFLLRRSIVARLSVGYQNQSYHWSTPCPSQLGSKSCKIYWTIEEALPAYK